MGKRQLGHWNAAVDRKPTFSLKDEPVPCRMSLAETWSPGGIPLMVAAGAYLGNIEVKEKRVWTLSTLLASN